MKHIFANWKMYLGFKQSLELIGKIENFSFGVGKINFAVFPIDLAVTEAVKLLQDKKIHVGAQNIAWVPQGAYTGAVSAHIFKETGCKYALVGHSERRYIFGETDEDVHKKIEACIDAGIIPVLCVGETEKDKEDGKKDYRLKKQLFKALEGVNLVGSKIIIAYEPVWAIGTGNACDPLEAEETHMFLVEEMKQFMTERPPLLYGGSVNSDNVLSYL
jgi:triosephosphate isomerase